jgi:hypothetical protein
MSMAFVLHSEATIKKEVKLLCSPSPMSSALVAVEADKTQEPGPKYYKATPSLMVLGKFALYEICIHNFLGDSPSIKHTNLLKLDPNYVSWLHHWLKWGQEDREDCIAHRVFPAAMCDPNFVAYRGRLMAVLTGEQDDCNAHGKLPPAQRSPAVVFAEMVRNAALPERPRQPLVSSFLSSAEILLRGQAYEYLLKSGLQQDEMKLARSLRVVDLRDVSKLIVRDCEGSDVSEAESDTQPQLTLKWLRGYKTIDFPQKRPSQPWSERLVSPKKNHILSITRHDLILLGPQRKLDLNTSWRFHRDGYNVENEHIPRHVNSKRIAIDLSEWLSLQLTPIRWEGNWTTDFFNFSHRYYFLKEFTPDKTVYVYWKPSQVAESFKIFAPRDQCDTSVPLNLMQSNFSAVVDLYNDERLAEMMSVRDHLQTHLSGTDVVGEAVRLHHSRLCVLCQRRRWETEYRNIVLKWWFAIFSTELLERDAGRADHNLPQLGLVREILAPQEAPINQEHPWVRDWISRLPKIRPCIVFDFEY